MVADTLQPLSLPVVETFHSIQGEGRWSGSSAFFIRLAGCNVGCPWCDTKDSWSAARHSKRSVTELVAEAVASRAQIIIITGGEPLMYDLAPLTAALRHQGLEIHLETSGAYPMTGSFDWVTLSPKRSKPPHPSIYRYAHELKVVVAEKSDFEWAEEQALHIAPQTSKRLQPEWDTPNSSKLVYRYILDHPTWQMSLQTHKYIGIH